MDYLMKYEYSQTPLLLTEYGGPTIYKYGIFLNIICLIG